MPALFMSSEFWSAIAGAVVGGLIAAGVQWLALRGARKDRAEERWLSQKGLANSLMLKLFRIQSNLRVIDKHIADCLAQPHEKGVELWQLVSPIANPPSPVHFTPDELGMLLAQKDNDTFNATVSMDETHNSVVESLGVYKEQRVSLTDLFPTPEREESKVFSGTHKKDEWMKLRPKMVNVNSVMEQLKVMANEGAKESEGVLKSVQKLLKQKGLISYNIELKPLAGAP